VSTDRRITYELDVRAADAPEVSVWALLEYCDADPFAVRLAFVKDGKETAVYTFGRELLADGLHMLAGLGAVMVRPHSTRATLLTLTLTQEPDEDGGEPYPFEVDVDRELITDFVDLSYLLVPDGQELADAELAAMLGGA
jgi:hypothetical protein